MSSFRRLALERPHGEREHPDEPDDGRRRDRGQAERGPGTEREPNRLGRGEGDELRIDRAWIAKADDLRELELGLEAVREEDGREDEGDDRIEDVEREPHEEGEEDRRAARLGQGREDQLQRDVERDQEEAQAEEREGEAPGRPFSRDRGEDREAREVDEGDGERDGREGPEELPQQGPDAARGTGEEEVQGPLDPFLADRVEGHDDGEDRDDERRESGGHDQEDEVRPDGEERRRKRLGGEDRGRGVPARHPLREVGGPGGGVEPPIPPARQGLDGRPIEPKTSEAQHRGATREWEVLSGRSDGRMRACHERCDRGTGCARPAADPVGAPDHDQGEDDDHDQHADAPQVDVELVPADGDQSPEKRRGLHTRPPFVRAKNRSSKERSDVFSSLSRAPAKTSALLTSGPTSVPDWTVTSRPFAVRVAPVTPEMEVTAAIASSVIPSAVTWRMIGAPADIFEERFAIESAATIRPRSMMPTCSQSCSTSERRCEERKTVLPFPLRNRIRSRK